MSSVIVKGMEMPDSCYHCKIAESCGHYIANYTDRRHPDCPLIALPEHHGRLVDADALRDRLQSLADDGWNKSTTTSWAEAFSECADMVDEAPTIEFEIIHCKDCKHWSRESICDGFCSEDCMRHDENFYCGYAGRRTNE